MPAIVDVPTGQVVTNDFAQMTLDLSTEWTAYHRDGAPDLYPEPLRDEIDEVAKRIYTEVNNGVYRCGFAGSQEAYDDAYDRLFTALDWLDERLANQRYLVGDTITEADVRLFTTLARFDAVYHGHFKCNRHKLDEMPVLWAYARDLFQTPGFGDTIDFVQIKQHYYVVHADINPTRHRAEGARPVELADAARPGSVGRQAVRRRHPARTHARWRTGACGAFRRLGPDGADRPLGVRHRELVACLVADHGRQLHRDAGEPAAVRVDGGDGHRAFRLRCERLDEGVLRTFVSPQQHPWRRPDGVGHRQLHRVTRRYGQFSHGFWHFAQRRVQDVAVLVRADPYQLAVRVGTDLGMLRGRGARHPPDEDAGGRSRQHRDGDQHRQAFLHFRGTAAGSYRVPSCAARTGRFPPRPGIRESPR